MPLSSSIHSSVVAMWLLSLTGSRWWWSGSSSARWSRRAASDRASPVMRLLRPPARPDSGAARPPASWPRSCSREGSAARRWMSSRARLPPSQQPALDGQAVGVLAGEVVERLRGARGVALHPDEPAGPVEQRHQRVAAGLGRGPPGQRVLDHLELGPGVPQAPAQVRHLLDVEAPEVGGQQGLGASQALGERRDDLGLLGAVQVSPPPSCRPGEGDRGGRRRMAAPSGSARPRTGGPWSGRLRGGRAPPPWVFGRCARARATPSPPPPPAGCWCGWCRRGRPGPCSGPG